MPWSPAARRAFIPYGVLVIALILTAMAAYYSASAARTRDRLRFENVADRVKSAIDSRLDAYVAMLLGGAGLFAASDDVQLREFRAYVERLELAEHYPGIQGIGFSRLVLPEEREAIARRMKDQYPAFHFWPENGAGPTHAIVYLEPLDERNRAAIGYDMSSDPTRRAAMAMARDTAAPAASGVVRLVQEIDPSDEQKGFLIYVPVYRGGDVPVTEAERRERLMGFIYSPFRASDLLHSIQPAASREVEFDVYDGEPRPEGLLHEAQNVTPGPVMAIRRTRVGGRVWTLRMYPGPGFLPAGDRNVFRVVSFGGILLSVLLFAVTRTQVQARGDAERTAEELRRSEDALRRAIASKDEFLAVVSHELRTPLNAIVGWASMLRRGQVPPENLPHALEVIERNAVAQTRLVEDLLDISRAVAGSLRLQPGTADLTATLRGAVDAVEPSAAAQGVEIVAELAPDLGLIQADQARVQQVVLNLLSNGIKFTPRGGRVTLLAQRDRECVTIKVVDTGVGIRQEFQPFVFDRFRQADTSSTRVHGGVGLGLAIVRHLVELHGGTTEVQSAGEGQGAQFTVRLPAS